MALVLGMNMTVLFLVIFLFLSINSYRTIFTNKISMTLTCLILISFQALIDGPTTGVPRQAINLGQVVLTPLTFAVPRGAKSATVSKKWAAAGVSEKWATSSWAKKIAQRERRAALSDFERFQVLVLKKQKRYAVKKAVAKA